MRLVKSFGGWWDKRVFVTVWPSLGPAGANARGKREKFVTERTDGHTLSEHSEPEGELVCHRALFSLGPVTSTVPCVLIFRLPEANNNIKWTRQRLKDLCCLPSHSWIYITSKPTVGRKHRRTRKTSSPWTHLLSDWMIEVWSLESAVQKQFGKVILIQKQDNLRLLLKTNQKPNELDVAGRKPMSTLLAKLHLNTSHWQQEVFMCFTLHITYHTYFTHSL